MRTSTVTSSSSTSIAAEDPVGLWAASSPIAARPLRANAAETIAYTFPTAT